VPAVHMYTEALAGRGETNFGLIRMFFMIIQQIPGIGNRTVVAIYVI